MKWIIAREVAYPGIDQGVERLQKALEGIGPEVSVRLEKADAGIKVCLKEGQALVCAAEPVGLWRGLGILAGVLERNESVCEFQQETPFRTRGIMYDCSRNSVPTVATVEKLLVKAALMGFNTFMLYTEDVYEVEEFPAFGKYRGRYSKEELRTIDAIAASLGIELIPCIQTLAHLERFFRWPNTYALQDTDSVCLVGEEETYRFIEAMIRSISGCVRSKRIHLGLDEAHGLGLGRKLDRDGYIPKTELMKEHVERVCEICKRYGLHPMMWGDMMFRMSIPGGGYYQDDIQLTDKARGLFPKEMDVIYWDYYHNNEEFYQHYLEQHEAMGVPALFAGGVCSWIGMLPNLVKSWTSCHAGLSAARKMGVQEVFTCAWKDNGGEAPPGADLLGFAMFAENCWSEDCENDAEHFRNARILTGADYEGFYEVGSVDELLDGLSLQGLEPPNPQKYFLWQDILLGQYDQEASLADFASVYAEKAERLEEFLRSGRYEPDARYHLELAAKLCRVLERKVDIGVRLKQAYDDGDADTLRAIQEELTGELYGRLTALYTIHREAWHHFYKPFGWEVADIKYGGLFTRLRTSALRLGQYLDGEIACIEELEEPRLSSRGDSSGERSLCHSNCYVNISTTSLL